MSQTKHQIEQLLSEAGSQPRHRFGQNFMIDQNLVRLVADAGQIAPGDCVIEVGPGTGTLTEELLERGAQVLAVEIDRDLAAMLRARFADRPSFRLIQGDALAGKHAINPELLAAVTQAAQTSKNARELSPTAMGACRLVANLPYNIASPLVIDLLLAGVEVLAFTVQKEVAQRLGAAAGSEAYGPLSVVAQMLAQVEILRTLSPQAFWPAPRIESALVRLTRRDQLDGSGRAFSTFVHALFAYRRKMLRKAMVEAGFDAERLLSASKLEGTQRPEELSPARWLMLFQVARTMV